MGKCTDRLKDRMWLPEDVQRVAEQAGKLNKQRRATRTRIENLEHRLEFVSMEEPEQMATLRKMISAIRSHGDACVKFAALLEVGLEMAIKLEDEIERDEAA